MMITKLKMKFDKLSEFEKDLKHLLKKYRTLNEDIDEIKTFWKLSRMKDRLSVSV